MDSYNFHFDRMSNLDLHPLSLPVSRLSPAKSSSSIVDQLAHHQRGKGDSAYSSFSGGSTAQDYQSPFLGDELQPCSLQHYTDYKYVKAIYPPAQVLRSDPKTMDRLYRSVEAISQQYRHNGSSHSDDGGHSHGGARQSKTKPPGNQEVPPRVAPPPPALPPPPPPPPARLDSFIATRNLENSWLHQQGADLHAIHPTMSSSSSSEMPAPQPEAQPAPRPHAKPPPWDRSLYVAWRGQHQQLPVYRPHLQTLEPPAAGDDPPAAGEPLPQHQPPLANAFSHPPPRGRSLTDQHKNKKPAAAAPEGQQIGVRLANEVVEPARSASPWSPSSPNAVNGSIQHKGQFYFVTGVCASGETGARTCSLSSCATEAPPEPPCTPREHVKVKQRCHSTMEQSPGQHGPPKPSRSWEGLLSRSSPEENAPSSRPQMNFSVQSSRSLDPLEQPHLAQSGEAGRHTPNHPIFYCGPDDNTEQLPHLQEREEQAHRGRRQTLGDIASDRINKETTPLLYHLTGASRAALNPQIKDTDICAKGKDARIGEKAVDVSGGERSPPAPSHQGDVPLTTQACNAPDDSFTKYYKEKLKDAQRKVLRETSFKRKDLQLSWPHRVRPKPEPRATAIHSFASSRESEASTDAVTPSLASEEPERRAVKEDHPDRDGEGETGRPVNVAQPQVARVGGRKRISAEQKKLCYSEPEKLNQLGTYPQHSPCRSLGNEADSADDSDDSDFFVVERGRGEPWQQGEQGLVASRRKMFETRGRALSTSSLCKTSLKHIQHKALVEYMERKTGQKVAEPPKPQLTASPRQRLSLGEKPFDLVYKPQAGSTVNKTHKKKLSRPHSAGRILDSSTSSIRYAQFFSVHTGSVHCGSQPLQQHCQKKQSASQGKCASVENLLDQGEPPCLLRTRSTSIPPEFQAHVLEKDTPAAKETCSGSGGLQKNPEEPSERIPDGQQRTEAVRVTAQRGKSMEELGVWKLPRPTALSKSSEQLDQLRSPRRAPESEGTVSSTSVWEKTRQGKELWGSARTRPELEPVNQDDSLALGPPKCQQQSLSEQDLAQLPVREAEAELPTQVETRDLSRTGSPAASSSSRVRAHSGSPGVCGSVTEEVRVKRPSSDSSNPPSPRGQKTSEWEGKSTSSTPSFPVHKESPINSRPNSRVRTCPDASTPGQGQVMDEPGGDSAHSSHHDPEVSLSCGVAMDTPMRVPPIQRALSEEGRVSPLSVEDEVFTDESPTPLDAPMSTSADPGNAPEGGSETADSEETPEERGSPEGETESPLQPTERPQWAELVEAVAGADCSLAAVFYPLTNRKTALMLMEQLLSEDTLLMEEHYKKKQRHGEPAQSAETVEDGKPTSCISALDSQAPPGTDPESKADITEKKHLLVSVIEEHLRALEETHGRLQVEVLENASRGAAVQGLVRERCPPVELERYNLFIGDLERVVSLLLCLSARLARVQNALSTVDQHTDAEEKQSLDSRHHLLCKQREDAKDLKDNLDRRESVVATFLARQLSVAELGDYRRFVQTKASLLIRQKDLEERQRLREEQLEALRNSLPP